MLQKVLDVIHHMTSNVNFYNDLQDESSIKYFIKQRLMIILYVLLEKERRGKLLQMPLEDTPYYVLQWLRNTDIPDRLPGRFTVDTGLIEELAKERVAEEVIQTTEIEQIIEQEGSLEFYKDIEKSVIDEMQLAVEEATDGAFTGIEDDIAHVLLENYCGYYEPGCQYFRELLVFAHPTLGRYLEENKSTAMWETVVQALTIMKSSWLVPVGDRQYEFINNMWNTSVGELLYIYGSYYPYGDYGIEAGGNYGLDSCNELDISTYDGNEVGAQMLVAMSVLASILDKD